MHVCIDHTSHVATFHNPRHYERKENAALTFSGFERFSCQVNKLQCSQLTERRTWALPLLSTRTQLMNAVPSITKMAKIFCKGKAIPELQLVKHHATKTYAVVKV